MTTAHPVGLDPWIDEDEPRTSEPAMSRTIDERMMNVSLKAYVEWRRLSVAVQAAYDDWKCAPREKAAAAFLRYRTALDREERSSLEYAQLVEGLPA
jgi:hypothetical protein